MRYADGGALTMEGRSRREQVRLQAAEMFAQDTDARQIARSLRVSTKSVYQWRRAWRSGGDAALASKGPGGNPCKLDEAQVVQLRAAGGRPGRLPVGAGPAVDPGPGRGAGPAPVRRLSHAARGVVPAAPPRFLPAGPRAPRLRAGRGRDRGLADRDLGEGTRLAALTGAYICFEDEAGQALRPRRACTWAPRGHTPVARVSGRSGRLSMAGMACLKPGLPGRFFYRLRVHRRRRGERSSLPEADYAHLISAAHHALNAPVIVGWDNLNTHISRKMRRFTEARTDWLTVVQLPGYAPGLNAVEGAWSVMKSGLGNHAARTLDELEAIVRARLRQIQRRPELINALLGQTGVTLGPP